MSEDWRSPLWQWSYSGSDWDEKLNRFLDEIGLEEAEWLQTNKKFKHGHALSAQAWIDREKAKAAAKDKEGDRAEKTVDRSIARQATFWSKWGVWVAIAAALIAFAALLIGK